MATIARDWGSLGKLEPDIFLEAARRSGWIRSALPWSRTPWRVWRRVVVVTSVLVVGVDRSGQAGQLAASGTDIVVCDLGELLTGFQGA
jgi:hypothetical protein